MNKLSLACLAFAVVALAACGGGGGDPEAGVAIVGPSQVAPELMGPKAAAVAMHEGSAVPMLEAVGASAGTDSNNALVQADSIKRRLGASPSSLASTLIWSNGSGQTVAWGMNGARA